MYAVYVHTCMYALYVHTYTSTNTHTLDALKLIG